MEVASGKFQKMITIPTDSSIICLAYHPNGLQLASADWDNIYIWEIETRKPLQTFSGHTNKIKCIAYRPDGLQLASGSTDNTIRLWDLANAKLQQILIFPTSKEINEKRDLLGKDGVNCLAYRPDGLQLASGSKDKILRLWDLTTDRLYRELIGHDQGITCVAYSSNGL
jgi:WD40 repeat protein